MPLNPGFQVNIPHLPEFGGDFSPGIKSGRYLYFGPAPGETVVAPSTPPFMLNYGTQAAPVSLPTLPTAADAADTLTEVLVPGVFGGVIELYNATAQNIKPLVHATKGWEIGLQQLSGNMVEYVPGGNRVSNPLSYLAGTDPPVFIRALIEITVNNGMDSFMIGWRKQQAYVAPAAGWNFAAAVPAYTDFVGIGFNQAAVSPNPIGVSTQLASGGVIAINSGLTWLSAGIHQLEVRVRGRVASYFINGVRLGDKISKDGFGVALAATVTLVEPAKYTFANALRLIPFIHIRQNATLTSVFLHRLQVGQQFEEGLQPEGRTRANV